MELAYSLGNPIASRLNAPLIDNIVPLKKEEAHKQSLSANFGADDFPFHTDGAYFKIPPRYILLRYVKGIENPTSTIVCDLSDIDNEAKMRLKLDMWKVKSRNFSFYSSILSEDGQFYRYDRCIMTPSNNKINNATFIENLVSTKPSKEIEWFPNKTIIIDNWNFMHHRPRVKEAEINFRHLQRIMIL